MGTNSKEMNNFPQIPQFEADAAVQEIDQQRAMMSHRCMMLAQEKAHLKLQLETALSRVSELEQAQEEREQGELEQTAQGDADHSEESEGDSDG